MMSILIQTLVVGVCFELCFSYRLVFRRRPRRFLPFPKFPCTSLGIQWVRHPHNCSIYYVCGHGIPHQMPACPPDRVWSNSVTNCVPVRSRWDDCDYWQDDSEHPTKHEEDISSPSTTTSQEAKVSITESLVTNSSDKNDIDNDNDSKQEGLSTEPTQRKTTNLLISRTSKTKKTAKIKKPQTSTTTSGIRLWSKEEISHKLIDRNKQKHREPTVPSIPTRE